MVRKYNVSDDVEFAPSHFWFLDLRRIYERFRSFRRTCRTSTYNLIPNKTLFLLDTFESLHLDNVDRNWRDSMASVQPRCFHFRGGLHFTLPPCNRPQCTCRTTSLRRCIRSETSFSRMERHLIFVCFALFGFGRNSSMIIPRLVPSCQRLQ